MDKGAHFYRCDFQVHTPRDLQWSGGNAITEDERKAYANELVLDCRAKNLNAIAITDHHDFTFLKYVKEAARNEVDDSNSPVSLENQLTVFPGMELTLSSPPCQALLLLDSDFPVNLLTSIYPILAITQAPEQDSKCNQVVKLTCVQSFEELYEVLNRNDFVKDKFIILPNVSEGGNHTLLRSGFNIYYQDMPCVGGYLDGAYDQMGTGNLNIISGTDRNYGSKSLGIFQTSDNRQRDHAELGKYSSWVKWVIPSAEALRQACLAKESRISQVDPSLPAIYITSIDVSNSKFMGPIVLEFNQQYNALIGGRGTGKSTILEYLRWGLCDQPPELVKGDAPSEYQERRRKLIDKTIMPFDSTVQISFIKNGVQHVIKRKSDTHEVFLKIGDGEYELCKEFDVRNLLPIQAYSQKQLSSVGVSCDELKRLVFSPIRKDLNEHTIKFKELASDIRNCCELIQAKKLISKEIAKDDLELKSLNEQLIQLKKGLKGLSKEDQLIISSHAHYENADEHVRKWEREMSVIKQDVERFVEQLKGNPSELESDIKLSGKDIENISEIKEKIGGIFSSVRTNMEIIESQMEEKNKNIIDINNAITRWGQIYKEHLDKYEAAKQKTTSHEQILKQMNAIELRIKELRKNLLTKHETVKQKGAPEDRFKELREAWSVLHSERADKIETQCALLNGLSNENLRAGLARGEGTEALEEMLRNTLQGSRVQKDKIELLCERVKNSDDSVKEWNAILDEFEKLAEIDYREEGVTDLPLMPLLGNIGFTNKELSRIAEQMSNENWLDLLLVQLEDVPIFEYKSKEDEYIDFADASSGQQATALMNILLSQEGPPLIIDQPEDDLDNEMVSEIARLIWEAKTRRQLIFASHNANIVVNGDAELVVCCRYKIAADQSKGSIEKQGAIDLPVIKDEITKIMEGGEKAFKLRKEKYGF